MKQVSISRSPRHSLLRHFAACMAIVMAGLAQSALGAADIELPANLSYSVWMDDKPLGTHDYRFSLADQTGRATDTDEATKPLLQVDSNARFNVKILFVNVFSYEHHARELWNGHCLDSVTSETTTNGEPEVLALQVEDDQCAGTYTYWDKVRLQRDELTNAQTGKQETASWSELTSEPLPVPHRKARITNPPKGITHYKLTTPSASFLLWYDRRGRNLAMQTTNDGRTITYINRELGL